ncbi:hypothetical protein MKW94_007030, partial [Papaver nudicaule]|nr:hypothetical protein [Papaver nudicaule]
ADMPIPLQNQAFRCAKDCLDSMPNKKLDSKRLALALKKQFQQEQKDHQEEGVLFSFYIQVSLIVLFSFDEGTIVTFKV